MHVLEIDASRCCGDALCVRVCPTGCLRMHADKAAPVPLSGKLCLDCGHCVAVCPKAAVSIDGRSPDELAPARNSVTPEAFSMLARTRRSMRAFRPDPVPHEILAAALDTARYAPTGKNSQDVAWIAVEGEEKLAALGKLVIDSMRTMPGTERLVEAFERGRDPILRKAPCVVFAHGSTGYGLSAADCAIAMTYCELALHSMGLGSCWAGYVLGVARHSAEVRTLLGLPEGREAYAGLMVGYPALRYQRIPDRKPAHLVWV
ncbi:MAG: nitroreductase family protein [Desulfovibrionaceae bacterium]|nr:nitroreductase family protein [Desulfovibrionaceae bacterium]